MLLAFDMFDMFDMFRRRSALPMCGSVTHGFKVTKLMCQTHQFDVCLQEGVSVPEEAAQDPLELIRKNGPWVYELYAVLIHSGSALGGHYYAHIKSLGDSGEEARLRPCEATQAERWSLHDVDVRAVGNRSQR